MSQEYLYPVHRLNSNITNYLNKIITAGVYEAITTGLSNEVEFVDKGGHITSTASIHKSFDGKSYVKLSSAFCQYFWLICNAALQIIDRKIIERMANQEGVSLDEYALSSKILSKKSAEEIESILPPEQKKFGKSLVDYMGQLVPYLLRDNFYEDLKQLYDLANNLRDPNAALDYQEFDNIPLDTPYELRTNSVCCYGIGFIMLHEMAHHVMGHLDRTERKDDEIEADQSAFWSIFNDVTGDDMFSAKVSIICVFFSLMMLNPTLEEDGIHPREDKRLFDYYDIIKDENPKYTVLVVYLLDFWAKNNGIENYPFDLQPNEESIKVIKEYFKNI